MIDDLGLCAVLEGCRELRVLSLAHVHAGDRVMHMLATKSWQLEVRPHPPGCPWKAGVRTLTALTGAELPPACLSAGTRPSPGKPSMLGCGSALLPDAGS